MTREELIKKIEHDNKRNDVYNRVMPHVLDILKKYNGKPYGEKTKDKICQELKDRCNCAVYFHRGYTEDIDIVPLNTQGYSDHQFNYNDFNVYVKYPTRNNKRVLITGNKINGDFTIEDFYLSGCHEYVADPAAHADNIIAIFAALKKQVEDIEHEVSGFNNLLPSGMEHYYINGFRRYL